MKLRTWIIFCVLFWVVPASELDAVPDSEDSIVKEYQIKASYLYNYMKFVTWPENSFAGEEDPFEIVVYGKNPFNKSLDPIQKRKVQNRAIKIHYVSSLKDLKTLKDNYHMIFVSDGSKPKIKDLNEALNSSAVLVISDSDELKRLNSVITFKTYKNRVKFRIDKDEAKSRKLVISSKLLNLSE